MDVKSAQSSKGLFGGRLADYPVRFLYVTSLDDAHEVASLIARQKKIEGKIAILTETLTDGRRSLDFRVIKIANLPPIYVALLNPPGKGPRSVGDVMKFVPFARPSGNYHAILYVHPDAVALFMSRDRPNNFPVILLHEKSDVATYFSSGIVGDSEKEVLYSLNQEQKYVTENIVHPDEYKRMKEEKHGQREPRSQPRPSRRDESVPSAVARPQKEKTKSRPSPKATVAVEEKPVAKSTGYRDVARRNAESEKPSQQPRSGRRGETKGKKNVDDGWALPHDNDRAPSSEQAQLPPGIVGNAELINAILTLSQHLKTNGK